MLVALLLNLFLFYIPFKSKGNFHACKLCAVLVSAESDSALCESARTLTPHCVSQFWIFGKCLILTLLCKSQLGV